MRPLLYLRQNDLYRRDFFHDDEVEDEGVFCERCDLETNPIVRPWLSWKIISPEVLTWINNGLASKIVFVVFKNYV